MYAHVGDRLVVEGDPARTGLIIGPPHEDGEAPYIAKWLSNGHMALVCPGQFGRIIPAATPGGGYRASADWLRERSHAT
jgi:hypothetical protein